MSHSLDLITIGFHLSQSKNGTKLVKDKGVYAFMAIDDDIDARQHYFSAIGMVSTDLLIVGSNKTPEHFLAISRKRKLEMIRL
jgi:hypothetical protein